MHLKSLLINLEDDGVSLWYLTLDLTAEGRDVARCLYRVSLENLTKNMVKYTPSCYNANWDMIAGGITLNLLVQLFQIEELLKRSARSFSCLADEVAAVNFEDVVMHLNADYSILFRYY